MEAPLNHSRTRDTTIDNCRETPGTANKKFVCEQDDHSRRPACHHRGQDGPPNGVTIPRAADRPLAAAIERHEARDEDESAERDERHGVAGDGVGSRRARGRGGGGGGLGWRGCRVGRMDLGKAVQPGAEHDGA